MEILIQFTLQRLTFILSLDAFALFPPSPRHVQALEDTHLCSAPHAVFLKVNIMSGSRFLEFISHIRLSKTESPERKHLGEAGALERKLDEQGEWTQLLCIQSVF